MHYASLPVCWTIHGSLSVLSSSRCLRGITVYDHWDSGAEVSDGDTCTSGRGNRQCSRLDCCDDAENVFNFFGSTLDLACFWATRTKRNGSVGDVLTMKLRYFSRYLRYPV